LEVDEFTSRREKVREGHTRATQRCRDQALGIEIVLEIDAELVEDGGFADRPAVSPVSRRAP